MRLAFWLLVSAVGIGITIVGLIANGISFSWPAFGALMLCLWGLKWLDENPF